MASTRELKRRINATSSIRQTTKAMELVSSARLRKAGSAATANRPYAAALEAMIAKALATEGIPGSHPLLEERIEGGTLLIVFASNRGLAGPYAGNLAKAATAFAESHPGTIAVTIGSKIDRNLKRAGIRVLQDYPVPPNLIGPSDLQPLNDFALYQFLETGTKEVYVLYSSFISSFQQEALIERLLPVSLPEPAKLTDDLLFEPKASDLLDRLLPYYADVRLYQAALEAAASEHAARRLAMKSASDNATERIDDLQLTYNQLRQNAITQELAEITGGAEALT